MHSVRSLPPYAVAVAALCLAGALAALLANPARAQNPPTCPDPTPTEVTVTAVPIVVTSTTADYFVLYVSHDVDSTEVELPVLVKKGAAGTTTLAENIEALPAERYRVEKYLIASPADVDGDCIDDITELDDFGNMNPVNSAGSVNIIDGAVGIPDRATFEALAYQFINMKFVVFGFGTENPRVYFQNANTHTAHYTFLDVLLDGGIEQNVTQAIRGYMYYYPSLEAADGKLGGYVTWDPFTSPFSEIDLFYTMTAASMPLLELNLGYLLRYIQLPIVQDELPLYEDSRIHLVFDEDIDRGEDFVPLNKEVGFGLLRALEPDERPSLRDVVIYETLPNNLPRVAGIISTVPQTPLSHVNLRAIQDEVPNAYIRDALDDDNIDALIDGYVRYEVTETEYSIRASTKAEVDAHYESSRPATPQTPQRDLAVTEITPLSEIGFDDWDAFGVKAANVAVLGKLDFPEGTVPDGFAIPFYFYDEFMKHNNFYTRIRTMLDDDEFQTNFDTQEAELKKLRKDIEDAATPQWIIDALVTMNESFAEGINRRYRSSTNNEDLPGFNGAGLYDSKSQKPSEDEDDLAKSLKEVYASLWNFRAFIERDFHRIDHLAAAMGVLVHPSYQDELVNGVAVSFDPATDREGYYYVNSQVGEDLVTNPEALSVPEEILIRSFGIMQVLATSNLVNPGELLMSKDQMVQLHTRLEVIHDHLEGLYNPAANEPFAIEIEFKITSENKLAIKQARPWVFSGAGKDATPTPDSAGTVSLPPTQPQVGTALTATLTDPDGGLSNMSWQWASSLNGSSNWATISGAASATYMPATADVGNYLRATAFYTDGHGPGKHAMAVSANPVEAVLPTPPPPDPSPTPAPSPTPDPSPTPAPPPSPSQTSGGGGGGGFGPAPVAPSFVDGFRTTRAVAENARPGDAVGDPVSATHPDELEITYSLSGTDAASFTVDEETGQISVKEGMDLTIGMTYTVNLTATDSAGFGAIIIVMIEVAEATHHAYDLNRNGKIDRDEIIKAIGDYFDRRNHQGRGD